MTDPEAKPSSATAITAGFLGLIVGLTHVWAALAALLPIDVPDLPSKIRLAEASFLAAMLVLGGILLILRTSFGRILVVIGASSPSP